MTQPHRSPQQTVYGIQVGTDIIVTLPGGLYDAYLTGMNINGPAKCLVQCFLGNASTGRMFETTMKSDSNSLFLTEPLRIPPAGEVTVVWRNATGSAYVNFSLRE